MSIFIQRRLEIKTQLSTDEIKQRINYLIKRNPRDDSFGYHDDIVDIDPIYSGYVRQNKFSISPTFRSSKPITFYSIDGIIKDTGIDRVIEIKMSVFDLVQKLVLFMFLFISLFVIIMLIGKQSLSLTYVLLCIPSGAYIIATIAARIGYACSGQMLKKLLSLSGKPLYKSESFDDYGNRLK